MAQSLHNCHHTLVPHSSTGYCRQRSPNYRELRQQVVASAGRHYKTRRQRSTGQKELQDLLIDPQYDALFDGSGEGSQKDPFSSGTSKRQRREDAEQENLEAFLQRREKEMRDPDAQADAEIDDLEQEDLSYMQMLKKYQRHYFLQAQQDEIMTHHHKMRASEVPPYAQATILAGLLEQYDNLDEYLSRHPQEARGGNPWLNAWNMIEDPDYNMDQDPLPAWMRAKRTIVQNWDAIEELNGNRQRTIERIRDFTELSPERQHMIDTWDPELYKGTPDPEVEYDDYLDRFLAISEKSAALDGEEEDEQMDTVGQAFVDELLQMDDVTDNDGN